MVVVTVFDADSWLPCASETDLEYSAVTEITSFLPPLAATFQPCVRVRLYVVVYELAMASDVEV